MFSRWGLIVLLVAFAGVCLHGALEPNLAGLEAKAKKLAQANPAFGRFYKSLTSEKEKAALRVTLDAYEKFYGSTVWAQNVAEDENGAPRYYDLALLGMSIGSGKGRIDFATAHAGVYELIVEMGYAGAAADYAREMEIMREAGGRDWRLARKSPLAVAVHAAVRKTGNQDMWKWYCDNHDWCDDYLMGAQPDPGDASADVALVSLMEELRHRPSIYKDLREEVLAGAGGAEGDEEMSPQAFLSMAMGVVTLYGEVFDVLARAGVPFTEAFDVLENNVADLKFDTPAACRETGVELANLHKNHKAVWATAAGEGGGGAVRFYRASPDHANAVLSAFGEVGVLPFLLEHYGGTPELLDVSAKVLHIYGEPGWSVLTAFQGNAEFRETLLMPEVGHLLVPFVILKGGEPGAVAQCREKPAWVKRYLNPDGSFKPETENIIEAMPFVGGIATVAKHWARGEPVTLGEIGWAAFDVIDDAITVAAFVGTAGAATPALAAKEAGEEALKHGAKTAVKQGSKSLTRAATEVAMKQGGKQLAKKSGTALAKKETQAVVRKSLARRALGWTIRVAGKPVRLASKPVAKTVKAWKSLPPQTRKWILRGAAAAMLFVVLEERTIPKLPEAIHQTLGRTGKNIGELLHGTLSGMGDAFIAGIASTVGIDPGGSSIRWGRAAAAIIAIAGALYVFFRGGRRRRALVAT